MLRFGLGFNAVYHLTDLPSFVSGPHLVLFDPHAAYLPGATPAAPGLRVEVTRGRLAEQFPDAAAPYQHYGCNMKVGGGKVWGRFVMGSAGTVNRSWLAGFCWVNTDESSGSRAFKKFLIALQLGFSREEDREFVQGWMRRARREAASLCARSFPKRD